MSRVPEQFENLLNYGKVENSKFYEPFKALDGDSDEVIEIQEEAMRVIHHEVMPAFQKLKGVYFLVIDQLMTAKVNLLKRLLYLKNFINILFVK